MTTPPCCSCRGPLTISPRDKAATRFIGPYESNKGEVRCSEQNDAHTADMLRRQKEPQWADTKQRDEVLCIKVLWLAAWANHNTLAVLTNGGMK